MRDMKGTYKHRTPRRVSWKFFAGFTIYFSLFQLCIVISGGITYMKTFKVITDNENYLYRAESKEQVEYEVIRDFFPNVLDDDLPDRMQEVEIIEV